MRKHPERQIDLLEKRAFNVALRIYRKQSVKWIKELRTIKSYESFITLSPMDRSFQKLFKKVFLLSYLLGYDSMKDEAQKKTKTFGESDKVLTGFDDANRFLKAKKVVSSKEYKKLSDYAKSMSFSVQKIEKLGAIVKVKHSLIKAINNGLGLEEWKDLLPDIFERFGITPLDPFHIETVFRTNISSVYNIGRFNSGMKDKNIDGFEYFAIDDSRITDICLSLDGKQYAKDNPIWESISPPNHYNCRSTLIPITLEESNENGFKYDNTPNKKVMDQVGKDFSSSSKTMGAYNFKIFNLLKKKKEQEKNVPKISQQLFRVPIQSFKNIKELEQRILKDTGNKFEKCYVLTSDNLLLEKRANGILLSFTDREIRRIKNAKLVVHNHPNSTSFSLDDIAFATAHNIRELRVVAPDSVYGDKSFVIKLKDGVDWKKRFEAIKQDYINETPIALNSAAIDIYINGNNPKYALKKTADFIWSRILFKYNIKYFKE